VANWRVGVNFELGSLVLLPAPEATLIHGYLGSAEVLALQALQAGQPTSPESVPVLAWRGVERILRHYCQHHLGRAIRSAALLDTLFAEDF
jgi:DNA repair protein RecO (recombination protein O)